MMEKVLIVIVIFTLAWMLVKFYMLNVKEKEEEQSRSEPFIVKSYPNGVMKTPENQEKIAKWLGTTWPDETHRCDICGSDKLMVADHIISSPIHDKTNVAHYAYPFVLIACDNCGNIRHFSAVHVGVAKRANIQ